MTPDHDSYINAKVRAERLAKMRDDLRTALTAARGPLNVVDILAMLVDEHGLEFSQCTMYIANQQGEIEKRYADWARENVCSDGDLEIDDNAIVSMGSDPGAYVMAWKWVDQESIEEGDE